jgi:hypothetical protein
VTRAQGGVTRHLSLNQLPAGVVFFGRHQALSKYLAQNLAHEKHHGIFRRVTMGVQLTPAELPVEDIPLVAFLEFQTLYLGATFVNERGEPGARFVCRRRLNGTVLRVQTIGFCDSHIS